MTAAFIAAMRLQLKLLVREPGDLVHFAIAPLLSLIFLAILASAGREDLFSYAVFAPVMITLWSRAVYSSGEIIGEDRWNGALEGLIASRVPVGVVVLGRVATITLMGFLSLLETWIVATVVFGAQLVISHPTIMIAALAATGFAAAGTGVLVAALFLSMRDPRTFQNSITYPFYVLGGVLVPTTLLPDWLEPLSGVVFLSWATSLLRDSLRAGAPDGSGFRIGAVLLLGAVALFAGIWLTGRRIAELRREGKVGFA